MAAKGTGSVVFIDDVTAHNRISMNSQVYRAILCAHIEPDDDLKHTSRATQEFLFIYFCQRSRMFCNGHAFHLLKAK